MLARRLFAILTVASLLLVSYLVLSPNLLPKTMQMGQKEIALKKEIETLKQDINRLTKEVDLLSGNSQESLLYLEKIARENLGLISKNEYVILLEPKK